MKRMTKKYRNKWPVTNQNVTILLFLLISIFNSVHAESGDDYKNRPLDVRVDRLERLMSSQKQLELLYRVKQLQEENQQLRGLLEEQNNDVRILQQQQRELYTDLNRRLSQMEGVDNVNNTALKLPEPSLEKTTKADALSPKADLPVVLDKSSVAETKYGVTQREEIVVAEEKTQPAVATIKPMSKKDRQAEQTMYQQAYDELRARRYTKARDSFVELIQKYPSGRYAHIAQYWVAEASYAQRNYEQAIIDYQLLLDVYPFSPKKAEAELKKAYSYYEQGNKETARNTLNQLLINYPDTTEAGQAKRLLKQL
ncbi:MAG: tol-pal system protein YbgF [gamma proteobacterium symbiont of Bathyaustriella thionipta]|nr:tol-pal system protein YbgF [gamma proteobacterium symbiont of Bathyaustriella thionipta]MCU7949704.1 tol-pal system protein YbgF [gamma proteobacterium symbiont of Bathyaustriella thionipta]MCU7953098.1 tol-pal system protein YbgF [gamma proteobacterium symbiont of Bathyaustriella thionipta]MCU7956288.1 tol-pal system protein YbgF [gamma proteobacterium symbiont of Bathyaustriella thionipta]MCU7967650.1 tol-pal system protein YbgF [gamma proteobacterium symbiont of Bathyaustriella thionipta